jgi:hypothetical protein
MKCTVCGDELDPEEVESPRRDKDGDIICDHCFEEQYSYTCPICEEMFDEDFSEKISPKYLLITTYAGEELGVDPGIYEIVSYPFYADGLIETHLFKSAVKKIADLPDDLDEDNLWCDEYYICDECVEHVLIDGAV